ncbi:unnamed protein product [Caenorhabditis brenneri]
MDDFVRPTTLPPPPPPPTTTTNMVQEKFFKTPYPQMLPLYEDAFKNMTLVGTVKIYRDVYSNLHMASG